MGMFGGIAAIPLYLQIVKGASPTKAGLLLLPMIAAMMSASLLSGQVTSRTGRYKIFPVAGSCLMVVGLLTMTQIGAVTALWQTVIYMAIFGFGLGMNMQSIVLAMQNSVDPRDMGVATSAVTFFRQVGGSLGTAIFLSILFSNAGSNINSELHKSGVTLPPGKTFNLNDTSGLAALPPQVRHPILVGFSDAMDLVFLVGAIVLVGAVVLSAMLKEVPLRTMSGQQARAAADNAAANAAAAAAAAAPVDVPPDPTGAGAGDESAGRKARADN
jgi:MFS family permease